MGDYFLYREITSANTPRYGLKRQLFCPSAKNYSGKPGPFAG